MNESKILELKCILEKFRWWVLHFSFLKMCLFYVSMRIHVLHASLYLK